MFPVYEGVGFLLVLAGWVAVGLPLAWLVFRDARWLIAVVVALIGAAVVVFGDPVDQPWEGVSDLFTFGSLAVTTLVLLGIGFLLKRVVPRLGFWPLCAGVVAPIALGVGVLLAQQRVPDSACSNRGVQVALSGHQLDLPVSVYSQLVVPQTGRWLDYRDWREQLVDKRDVRLICDLSKRGMRPVEVTYVVQHLWTLYPQGQFVCPKGAKRFCKGLPVERGLLLNSVSWAARTPRDVPRQWQVQGDPAPQMRGTVDNGSVCFTRKPSSCAKICRARRTGASGVITVESCQPKVAPDPAPHETLDHTLDWFEGQLSAVTSP